MQRIDVITYRSGRLRVHILSFLVWLAAVAGVVVLFRQRVARLEVVGLAQGQMHQVAATCTGRLKEVPVQLFDKVGQDQTVAVIDTILDDENLQTQLDTALAEVQHLQAELVSTQEQLLAEAANLETDAVAAQRRFLVDVENARLRVLEIKSMLETDRISLEQLELDNKAARIQFISDQNDAVFFELQQAKLRYNALVKKIEENERILTQAEQDLIQAKRRHDEFAQRQPRHPSVDSALDVIRKAVKVQEQRIEELLARRTPLVLKSPFDGVVSQIHHGQGEAVLAGDPILTVVETRPSEIIAYASGEQAGRVRDRMVVELITITEPPRIATSKVVNLGAKMELMPQQLWRNTNIPQWGRPVMIEVPPGLELVPGEVVGIRGL
ncbi:MAG TPA: HlyD family efflux transporter periplasmic adaptor subunit [Sedimentisphaerales bacterium]|nr:HlyD family efflux transporter periplasmic adaptor subunit [Sedimentisphaerales bacterium]